MGGNGDIYGHMALKNYILRKILHLLLNFETILGKNTKFGLENIFITRYLTLQAELFPIFL